LAMSCSVKPPCAAFVRSASIWNLGYAEECGGFDLTDLWGVDRSIASDMLTVFSLLTARRQYPDAMGYGKQFEAIVRAKGPRLGVQVGSSQ
jgi:hypothetical protein